MLRRDNFMNKANINDLIAQNNTMYHYQIRGIYQHKLSLQLIAAISDVDIVSNHLINRHDIKLLNSLLQTDINLNLLIYL